MKTIRTRFRLTKTVRTALFQEQKTGGSVQEYAQTDIGTTVTLSQIQGQWVRAAGELTLVLNSAEAKLFQDAAMGAEFDLVISPAKAE